MAQQRYVAADPYPWPYNGDLRQGNTALIVIKPRRRISASTITIGSIGARVRLRSYPIRSTSPPIPQKSVCMSQCLLPHAADKMADRKRNRAISLFGKRYTSLVLILCTVV